MSGGVAVAEKAQCVHTSAAALYSAAFDRSFCAHSSRKNQGFFCLPCLGRAGRANLMDQVMVDTCEMFLARSRSLCFFNCVAALGAWHCKLAGGFCVQCIAFTAHLSGQDDAHPYLRP